MRIDRLALFAFALAACRVQDGDWHVTEIAQPCGGVDAGSPLVIERRDNGVDEVSLDAWPQVTCFEREGRLSCDEPLRFDLRPMGLDAHGSSDASIAADILNGGRTLDGVLVTSSECAGDDCHVLDELGGVEDCGSVSFVAVHGRQ